MNSLDTRNFCSDRKKYKDHTRSTMNVFRFEGTSVTVSETHRDRSGTYRAGDVLLLFG